MSTFESFNSFVKKSATFKILGVALLALILLIPAFMVDSLIRERQNLRDSAVEEISSKWGKHQNLKGPVLHVPYTQQKVNAKGEVYSSNGTAYFLPENLNYTGDLQSEERSRGIYSAVLYKTTYQVKGQFSDLQLDRLGIDKSAFDWDRATLVVGVSDLQGIERLDPLTLNGTKQKFEPGVPDYSAVSVGFQAPIKIQETDFKNKIEFEFGLVLRGSSLVSFTPLGATTTVNLTGSWGAPKFDGSPLPTSHTVTNDKFVAEWKVLEVNRPFKQQGLLREESHNPFEQDVDYNQSYSGRRSYSSVVFPEFDFGVRLLLPVDEYRKIYRSSRYSMLFISATFLVFFFSEVLNRKKVHPVQYLLVGFAIVLFYILLLSISEHLGFNISYCISTGLILGLITAYTYALFRNVKLTALISSVLAVLYIFFYSLLQLEDYSLLIGSFGLLISLAVIMYLTRGTDWYNLQDQSE